MEYYKVLKPKGILVCISFGLPEKRIMHFKHPDFNWELRIDKAIKLRQVATDQDNDADGGPEPEYHYIYICVKVAPS
jgi:ubiquinone/menaquinone biosynthesis C-methylase UbiE